MQICKTVAIENTWWRHQMETFSALLALCAGNSPVPVNSPHKGQWRGALMFTLICARINDWVNNREAGDLRRLLDHYDVSVMIAYHLPRVHLKTNCHRLLWYEHFKNAWYAYRLTTLQHIDWLERTKQKCWRDLFFCCLYIIDILKTCQAVWYIHTGHFMGGTKILCWWNVCFQTRIDYCV